MTYFLKGVFSVKLSYFDSLKLVPLGLHSVKKELQLQSSYFVSIGKAFASFSSFSSAFQTYKMKKAQFLSQEACFITLLFLVTLNKFSSCSSTFYLVVKTALSTFILIRFLFLSWIAPWWSVLFEATLFHSSTQCLHYVLRCLIWPKNYYILI